MFDGTPRPPGNFNFESPSPAAQAALGAQNAAPPTSAPRQQQPPPAPLAATFNIAIYGDNAATPGFYPIGANVYQGTILIWTNKDSQPRSVVSDSGDPASFSSPLIPPGGTWKFTANLPGSYNYHDGTRPYALGSFKVVAK